ncbi:MAG TPA: SET domain-containing protein [Acidimicrobiales bacterium]|nr:SET domain-containing protein [Acidimicrobiales bacterium]
MSTEDRAGDRAEAADPAEVAEAADRAEAGAADPPREVWVSAAVRVGPSSIAGQGLFATADLAAGARVLGLGGRLVTTAELARLVAEADADPAAPYVDTITVDDDANLVLPPGTPAHAMNHSCDPNVWLSHRYDLVTRRAVPAGVELTVDYATISGAPGLDLACRCGSAACRGRVSSDDWRRSELQARYRGHWTPALAGRMAR